MVHTMEPRPQLILEAASSLSDAMKRVVRYAMVAAEAPEATIETEGLGSRAATRSVGESAKLELGVSEDLDVYQYQRAH